MGEHRKFGSLSSSANPEELANTVRGAILAVAGVIVYFATNVLGIKISMEDVATFAAGAAAVAGGVWTCYGLILKIVVAFAKR